MVPVQEYHARYEPGSWYFIYNTWYAINGEEVGQQSAVSSRTAPLLLYEAQIMLYAL